jgi:hypothetical protein
LLDNPSKYVATATPEAYSSCAERQWIEAPWPNAGETTVHRMGCPQNPAETRKKPGAG